MGGGTLIEFGGLPGTGKPTLARRVAERTGAGVAAVLSLADDGDRRRPAVVMVIGAGRRWR